MKTFNIAYLAIVAALAVAVTIFNQASRRADTYMQAEMKLSAHAMTPHLKALPRVADTPANRAKWSCSWCIAPGDGYLYAAPWLEAIPGARTATN